MRLDQPARAIAVLEGAAPTFQGLYTLALAHEREGAHAKAVEALVRLRALRPAELRALEAQVAAWEREKVALEAGLRDGGEALRERRAALGTLIAGARRRLSTSPAFVKPAWRLGLVAFLAGDLPRAWAELGWRRGRREFELAGGHVPGTYETRQLPARLDGLRVELRREQGLGDTLFFLRYAPRLRARGAIVSLRCDARLHGMLGRTGLFDEQLDESAPRAAPPDFELSTGDLLEALGLPDAADLPPPLPLRPLSGALERARATLGSKPTLAITWRAGSQAGDGGVLFKAIDPLLLGRAVAGFAGNVASVQRSPTAEENARFREGLGRDFLDLSAWNEDLEAMLAVMAAVERYAGVSNTNMHLRAGAGLAATVLAALPPEWRWPPPTARSPWFPGFEVLREEARAGWAPALAALARGC